MNIRVKIGDQIFVVEVGELSERPIMAKVDCDTFEVWPEEERLELAGANAESGARVLAKPLPSVVQGGDRSRVITAPIPGVIISITVKPGDTIVHGQELCMLEAMKMKNAIRATRTGTIAAIHVAVGDHVRHGQPLVDFTD